MCMKTLIGIMVLMIADIGVLTWIAISVVGYGKDILHGLNRIHKLLHQ